MTSCPRELVLTSLSCSRRDGVKIAEWTSAKMICLKGMERWVLEFSLGES